MSKPTRVTIGMPRLGETMEHGTIANWLIDLGSTFKRGDPLLELETDKTLVEYPALGSGILIETLVESGDIVEIGEPIAVIESTEAWQGVHESVTIAEPTATETITKPDAATVATRNDGDNLRATPMARRLAISHNVSLETVTGSGRRGRIEARDIESHVAKISTSLKTGTAGQLSNPAHAVVFVHGFAGLGSNWATMRSGLKAKGIASTAPDLPGHGQNVQPANSAQDIINWLVEYLEEQEQPLHLIGHSLGAHVAAMAAKAQPNSVARLSLVAPVGFGPEINGEFLLGMATADSINKLRQFLQVLGPTAKELPEKVLQAMTEELAEGRLTALANDIASDDSQRVDTISTVAELSQSIPVSAVFGVDDLIVPKEHVFNVPSKVSLHILQSGHMPHWDSPDQLEQIIS
ncbi:MAG: acetoin dehydrogenase dihydrolipoyllysine-residue acetyltransferase subunit [Pseudomonadota bacterium]